MTRPSTRRLAALGGLAAGLLLPLAGVSGTTREAPAHDAPVLGGAASEPPPPQLTRLSLPFSGTWGVIQGFESGDTHTGYAAYALDFVPAQPIGTRAPRHGAPLSPLRLLRPPGAGARRRNRGGRARRRPRLARLRQGTRRGELRHPRARRRRVHRVPPPGGPLGHRSRRRSPPPRRRLGRCGNSGNATTPTCTWGSCRRSIRSPRAR